MAKKRFEKTFVYKDEINDDFSLNNIEAKPIEDTFKFYNSNLIARFFNMLFRQCIIIPILFLATKCNNSTKVVNRKLLKQVKGKGYFLYSNHTCNFDPINHAVMIDHFRYSAIMAGPESFSIKGIRWLIKALGAFPTPSNRNLYKPFRDCMEYHISKRHKIIVYPEAHIWPYYTGIRDFKVNSFKYPYDLKCPIMVATTTYRKRKYRKAPKIVIYLDGPFYPDLSVDCLTAAETLRKKAYDTMCLRANIKENYAINNYIKDKV